MYKLISEEEIKKELESFKKPVLYTCNRECQHFCVYYEGKYCIRCIPLEKGERQLESDHKKILKDNSQFLSTIKKFV